jgi:hypothetical protein
MQIVALSLNMTWMLARVAISFVLCTYNIQNSMIQIYEHRHYEKIGAYTSELCKSVSCASKSIEYTGGTVKQNTPRKYGFRNIFFFSTGRCHRFCLVACIML